MLCCASSMAEVCSARQELTNVFIPYAIKPVASGRCGARWPAQGKSSHGDGAGIYFVFVDAVPSKPPCFTHGVAVRFHHTADTVDFPFPDNIGVFRNSGLGSSTGRNPISDIYIEFATFPLRLGLRQTGQLIE